MLLPGSSYEQDNYLQHAYFYFRNTNEADAAIETNNLAFNNKKLEWTDTKTKLCTICSSSHHNASSCLRKRNTPKDKNTQYLYQRFQPAQFNGYTVPKKPRGAVRDNLTFADMA